MRGWGIRVDLRALVASLSWIIAVVCLVADDLMELNGQLGRFAVIPVGAAVVLTLLATNARTIERERRAYDIGRADERDDLTPDLDAANVRRLRPHG